MNYLEEISKEVKFINDDMQSIIDFAMQENEDEIRKWIAERWLTGKTPNGDLIGMYRGEDYAEYKNALNSYAGFGNVDLTLSGAMSRNIIITNFNNGDYEVSSTVSYYQEIIDKYGDLNFNITDNQKNLLFDNIISIIFMQIDKAYE